jgi:hypothetical protein
MGTPTFVVVLLGFPGTGKYTIAKEVRAQYECVGRDVRVIDNHYTANLVFGVLPLVDGYRAIPPETWPHVGRVRAALWDAILELSAPETSFVFTTDISAAEGASHLDPYRRIAVERGSTFVPVRLLCDADELARRIVSAERRERSKWLDADGVRHKHATNTVLEPADPATRTVDVTSLAPADAAAHIRSFLDG